MAPGHADLINLLKERIDVTKVKKCLSGRSLCDHCLGRLFGKIGHGYGNEDRGEIVREMLGFEATKECWLCDGIFNELNKFKELAMEELSNYDFESFLVGTRVDPVAAEREEGLWVCLQSDFSEPIKSELNREIGKLLERDLNLTVDFENPDVVAIVDTCYDSVELQVSPLFVYGRYRKLERGIPQTSWLCSSCLGKGCEKCSFSGKMYPTSVEEIIASPLETATRGEGHSFHGMGREDIDARMLGNGRPFVLEIKRPRRRAVDFEGIQEEVNKSQKVEVFGLRPSSKQEVIRIKASAYPKTYLALVSFDNSVEEEKLNEVVRSFKGLEVAQRTPLRVAHRRADLVRKRRVIDAEAEWISPKTAKILISADAGTYIKELINGDGGRTKPSVAERLEIGCEVEQLDVMEIHDEDGDG